MAEREDGEDPPFEEVSDGGPRDSPPSPSSAAQSTFRRQQEQHAAMIKAVVSNPALDAIRRQQEQHAAMIKAVVSNPALDAIRRQQEQHAAMIKAVVSNPALDAIRRQQEQHAAMIKAVVSNPALDAIRRQQEQHAAMIKAVVSNPALDAIRRQQEQHAAMLKNVLPGVSRITDQLLQVAKAAKRYTVEVWPVNLRGIEGLTLELIEQVVVTEGIPLSGVPRASISKALIGAGGPAERRAILGRRWKAIAQDCEEVLRRCGSPSTAADREFALKAVAALRDGHAEASQALAANLLDTMLTKHFRADRVVLVPSRSVHTPDGYGNFALRKFLALGPIWSAYTRFFPQNGDRTPRTFARHASAHAVSRAQFSRRNAVQGVMLVASLIGYLESIPGAEL